MKQSSFSDAEFAAKKKVTRRERLLQTLDLRVPWAGLVEVIEPHYPTSGRRGRPPMGVERMLRMYVLQQVLGLSDEGTEDAIYDSQSARAFVGIDLGREAVPDATTLLKFRRLLEKHGLTRRMFDVINAELEAEGLLLRKGTIVDATLIAAAPSTKNAAKARDPEMRQSKKGNQWFFGMKGHVGVDAVSGLVHSVKATPGNEADVAHADELLHGEEEIVLGDAGYTGIEKREEHRGRPVRWLIAERRSKLDRMLPTGTPARELVDRVERLKASARSLVEHPFLVVKRRFNHRKVRYRGIAKNEAQLFALFALGNLLLIDRRLCPA
jgi:IS5 family transposase